MDASWVAVIVSGVIQIVGIAYVTGRYSQMMADHGRRLTELEDDAKMRIFPKLDEYNTRISLVEQSVIGRRGHHE